MAFAQGSGSGLRLLFVLLLRTHIRAHLGLCISMSVHCLGPFKYGQASILLANSESSTGLL